MRGAIQATEILSKQGVALARPTSEFGNKRATLSERIMDRIGTVASRTVNVVKNVFFDSDGAAAKEEMNYRMPFKTAVEQLQQFGPLATKRQ